MFGLCLRFGACIRGIGSVSLRSVKRLPHLAFHCAAICIATILAIVAVQAQSKSYWLVHGFDIVASCEGNSQGQPLRAANRDNQWILITAVVTCKDLGPTYSYEIAHLVTQINPSSRDRINRDKLNFDWIGLAVYRPAGAGETINWTYDEALPLRGSLPKTSNEKIIFGRLTFPPI